MILNRIIRNIRVSSSLILNDFLIHRMEFMKRAIQKQKEEAKLEAEKLIHALQEEQEMDYEFQGDESEESEEKEETPVADDEQVQSIREALSSGSVKRTKKQNKVLEVTDAISIKQVCSMDLLSIAHVRSS